MIYITTNSRGNLIPNIEKCWEEIGTSNWNNPGRKEPTSGEINYKNVFKYIHSKGFNGILGMEHGNFSPGIEGEKKLILAYQEVDKFI